MERHGSLILQYILDDYTSDGLFEEEPFSSEDEFSGEDVGDGSDDEVEELLSFSFYLLSKHFSFFFNFMCL